MIYFISDYMTSSGRMIG